MTRFISANSKLTGLSDLGKYYESRHSIFTWMDYLRVKTKRFRSLRRFVLPHVNTSSPLPAHGDRRIRRMLKPSASSILRRFDFTPVRTDLSHQN
ncbi:hypothetical protein EVAR_12248_1 [Eumeta japonica]|uniref:Uncharacterized protein n=1 Tax=Eumeta variegata TaxID=151549 RepID=A0A4C1TUT0_EUMVA|nr:hypothetical protein EVAR_12248_1 [Eumeta japonica]